MPVTRAAKRIAIRRERPFLPSMAETVFLPCQEKVFAFSDGRNEKNAEFIFICNNPLL
jgi:hypothetical protein